MSDAVLNNTTFILVRPEYLGNIGSTCRVMKNFGFTDLRLVNPPRNYKDAEARQMAVAAFDVLKNAAVYDQLEDAIADIHITISTSSGRLRSRPLDNLADIVDEIADIAEANKIAFVFGNERNGLLDEEVSLCNRRMRIESSEIYPALNLAQAVGIIAYSLATTTAKHTEQPSAKKSVVELPSAAELKQLFEQLDLLLGNVEFSRTYNKRLILQELKDGIDRMTPSRREAAILKGALFRLNDRLKLASKASEDQT